MQSHNYVLVILSFSAFLIFLVIHIYFLYTSSIFNHGSHFSILTKFTTISLPFPNEKYNFANLRPWWPANADDHPCTNINKTWLCYVYLLKQEHV